MNIQQKWKICSIFIDCGYRKYPDSQSLNLHRGFPGDSAENNLPANARNTGSIPGWGRCPEEGWQPTPVFLPGKPHGQRSLVDYISWGHKSVRHDLAMKQQLQTCMGMEERDQTYLLINQYASKFCRLDSVPKYYDNMYKWKLLSHVRLFATPQTIQSMDFSRPEYWSG